LRFAALRPGSPEASPRSHGVPRRDVPGRIHISVAGETAGRAHEVRLALTRLPVHMPARRAPLACESGFDLLHPAGCLLFQSAHQQAPSGSEDAPVEPGLLADVPSWVLGSAFRGSGHVPDLEVLDVPASSSVHRHPIGFHAWRHRPGPAESHPPGFRNPDLAGLPAQPPHAPLLTAPPHNPEPLIPADLPPRRPPSRILRIEERGHRLGEVPQRLLLHHLRTCGQPRVLCPRLGELPTLLQVARSALPARPPVPMLLDGEVPHVPGVRAVHPRRRLLGGCREQPVPGHTNTLSTTTDIAGEVKRRFLREVRAEVSAPRSL
jgi:hypothetical protein